MSTRPSTRPLTAALGTIPADYWTLLSNYADNRVHHLYQRCDLVVAGQWGLVPFEILDMIEDVERSAGEVTHDAWLSRIQPGGYIVPHTDRSRWRERWHIPIQTAGYMLVEDEYMTIGTDLIDSHPITEEQVITGEAGVPFRVEHWLPHSVENHSDRDRIHVVIDLDRYVGPDEARPFVIL